MCVEDILKAMDSHHQVHFTLLDFTKAFNTVPHKHLLTKLHYYGISSMVYSSLIIGSMLGWVEDIKK